jgi:glycosyltransferase involved in cell wall biosynthesis
MELSVILCTYNRCHNLAPCLTALARQEGLDGVAWEVVVVDNNSTDATRATVEGLAAELPITLRYGFEGQQGLSHARNRGIQEAAGRYLCFMDDDIEVTPGWLAALYHCFRDFECDAVGGPIHLRPPRPLPGWIRPDMQGFLGFRDLGSERRRLDGRHEFPFGGNMAFDRRVVERIGLFDTELGRRGEGRRREELFKGEETDYFLRLTAAGGTIYYAPGALVFHQVLEHPLHKRFFRTLHYNAGLLSAQRDPERYPRTVGGIPLFLLRQLLRAALRYGWQVARHGSSFAFRQQMNVGYFLGRAVGYARR